MWVLLLLQAKDYRMKKSMKKYWAGMIGVFLSLSHSSETTVPIFEYHTLSSSAPEIMTQFHERGYIAVRGVPGFIEAYNDFLGVARQFVAQSPEEKAKCTPSDPYALGWSTGIESFNGVRDSYKGSYYANIPQEENHPNIWPILPGFKEKYETLGSVMYKTGALLLSLIREYQAGPGLGRMLYYSPVFENKDDGSPNWCGNHRDHGLFTALCPEKFFKEGMLVEKPEGSGLYILDQEISPPDDVMLFQIGEIMEIITNGEVKATDHLVKKAYGGYERFAFAFFFDTPADMVLHCTNPDVIKKYEDRYTEGMTFQLWNDRSLAKYN